MPACPPGAADLDFAAVRAFLAVVEHRHFGRAAQSLTVAVSTVTKRVARLESCLDTVLLERGPGGVTGLTDAGRRFQHYAVDLMCSADRARAVARSGALLTLRIAVPAGAQMAAPLMGAELATLEALLELSHPGIRLTLCPARFDAINTALFDKRADVALVAGEPTDPGLAVTRLGRLHRVGLVGATHPYALRTAVYVREFAEQPMLHPIGLAGPYINPFLLTDVRPLARAKLVPVTATSAAEIVQQLMAGREVTVVPAALTANLPRGITRVTLTGAPCCAFTAVYRSDDARPELRALIDLMAGFTDSISQSARL